MYLNKTVSFAFGFAGAVHPIFDITAIIKKFDFSDHLWYI